MAIRKVKYNDTFIYIDDELDEKELDTVIDENDEDKFDKTEVIKPINEKDILEDTLTDINGGQDGK